MALHRKFLVVRDVCLVFLLACQNSATVSFEIRTNPVIHYSRKLVLSFISYNVFVNRDVTAYLRLLLRKEGFNFHSSSELEIVRTIKEVRQ